jgi:hypothetical protein
MGGDAKDARRQPYRIEVVQGKPYHVEDRILIPEARITSYGRGRATIGTHNIGGWGLALTQIKPLAVIEQTAEGEQRVVITDVTTKVLRLLLATAVVMMVFFGGIRCLVRLRRGTSTEC